MWGKYALLYIGKSNKHFTNGRVYEYTASSITIQNSHHLFIETNIGVIKHFGPEHTEYIDENFRFVDEYRKLIRKNKLNKIKGSKNGKV